MVKGKTWFFWSLNPRASLQPTWEAVGATEGRGRMGRQHPRMLHPNTSGQHVRHSSTHTLGHEVTRTELGPTGLSLLSSPHCIPG